MKLLIITLLLSCILSSCGGKIQIDGASLGATVYQQKTLKNVGIYYAYLNSLNYPTHAWDNDKVITDLDQYDILVIGDGIEKAAHPDYANSSYIIPRINSSVEVFGYVDIGNTVTHSMADMKTSVDEWETLGVEGVFLDEFGFDYWSGTDNAMRLRQNEIIDYIHTKNLKVFVNAWDPDDVFVKESSSPSTISSGDYYLAESYVFSTAGALNFTNHLAKMAKINSAQTTHGIKAFGVSTTNALGAAYSQTDFDFMSIAAQLDGLDGIGWGTVSFAATTEAGLMPFRSITSSNNSLKLTGSNSVDNGTEVISRSVLDGRNVNADYLNQTFTLQ
ncbi:MAG: hypothetical protein KC493_15410 [Bacteriovoracaceae bacterium]|nr:hypothetical protein [Bacteriovoracaceae bacterium]